MARRVVVFYVSGHGFGHATRSIEVINALLERRPDARVIIRSSIAAWLVERTARTSVRLSPIEVDTGVVQLDSLHLDAAASIAGAAAFMSTFDSRVQAEVAFLREHSATLTISDLPPLGIAAGCAAGIPALATGNFTWDWIYQHYEGGDDVAQQIGDIYRDTTLALRMPMWGGFETMPIVRDLPFVARRSKHQAGEVRDALGIPRDKRAVLTSFGGYGLDGIDASALSAMPGYHVILPGAIDEEAIYERGYRYEDLVRAVMSLSPSQVTASFRNVSPTTPRCCIRLAGIFGSIRCWSTRCPRFCAAASLITPIYLRAGGRRRSMRCSRSRRLQPGRQPMVPMPLLISSWISSHDRAERNA